MAEMDPHKLNGSYMHGECTFVKWIKEGRFEAVNNTTHTATQIFQFIHAFLKNLTAQTKKLFHW